MKFDFPRPININLTETCLQSLIETYNSWLETAPYQYDDYKQQHKSVSDMVRDNNSSSINSEVAREIIEEQ